MWQRFKLEWMRIAKRATHTIYIFCHLIHTSRLHSNMRISNNNSSVCDIALPFALPRVAIIILWKMLMSFAYKKWRETFRIWWCLATIRNCNNNRAFHKIHHARVAITKPIQFFTRKIVKRMDKGRNERTNGWTKERTTKQANTKMLYSTMNCIIRNSLWKRRHFRKGKWLM